jgi:hypothetical protein
MQELVLTASIILLMLWLQAGLAGLAFDEGTFGVFGYVTEVSSAQHLITTWTHPASRNLVCNNVTP